MLVWQINIYKNARFIKNTIFVLLNQLIPRLRRILATLKIRKVSKKLTNFENRIPASILIRELATNSMEGTHLTRSSQKLESLPSLAEKKIPKRKPNSRQLLWIRIKKKKTRAVTRTNFFFQRKMCPFSSKCIFQMSVSRKKWLCTRLVVRRRSVYKYYSCRVSVAS